MTEKQRNRFLKIIKILFVSIKIMNCYLRKPIEKSSAQLFCVGSLKRVSMKEFVGLNKPSFCLKGGVLSWGLLCFMILFLVGCGEAPKNSFSKEALRLDERFSSTSIKQFVSQKNLTGLLSKEHYQVKARLTQDQSSLEFFSHSRVANRGDGVRVKIERKNNNLIVTTGVEGYPNQTLLVKENHFEGQSEIDWTLEIENGTLYGFRVQVWENFLNRSGFIKRETFLLTTENKLVDSLEEGLTFYTKGKGLSWGIKTYKTDLISAYRVPVQEL